MRETFQSGSFIFCFYFLQRCRLAGRLGCPRSDDICEIRPHYVPEKQRQQKFDHPLTEKHHHFIIAYIYIYIYIYIYYCCSNVQKINIFCDTFKFLNMRSNFVLISQHKRAHEQPERTLLWLNKHCSHLGLPASYYELPSFS